MECKIDRFGAATGFVLDCYGEEALNLPMSILI